MNNKKITSDIISRINFILLSILFSVFYWILESIRDVITFNKGPLIQRIFIPDTLSLWMRLLIVFTLILFGTYVQSGSKYSNNYPILKKCEN